MSSSICRVVSLVRRWLVECEEEDENEDDEEIEEEDFLPDESREREEEEAEEKKPTEKKSQKNHSQLNDTDCARAREKESISNRSADRQR